MHKIGILASLAHGFWVNPKEIYVEGIRAITGLDIRFAGLLGYTIKLLGIVKKAEAATSSPRPSPPEKEREKTGRAASGGQASCAPVQVSVYPALIPDTHVMASVNDVFNAV